MPKLLLSRRTVVAGGLALASVGKPAFSAAAPGRARLLPVRGTRLYVEEYGARDAPALVYLHGGPGVGSYEFSHYASGVFARDWRLIVFDQRGVLRSDPLRQGQSFGIDDLVADIDALRQALGIKRWSLLGHSFGGHYALRYALAYPDHTATMFLENPAYSFPESTRSNLEAAAALYRSLGKSELAEKAEALTRSSLGPRELLSASIKAQDDLGRDRQQLYLYDQRWRGFFGRLSDLAGLRDAQWEQGQVQAMKLFDEGKILEPMIGRLAEWRGPTVLIKGETDHACSPAEMAAVSALPNGKLVRIARAGHFIHVEQPGDLARAVASAGARS